MGSDRDIAIIGAGPAGAVAARLLAGWGFRVLLVTRAAPRPALAESLPPSALRLLRHVGVDRAIAAERFLPATGNSVWWGGAGPRAEPFPAAGLQVDRARFDAALFTAARDAGAAILRPASALSMRRRVGCEPRFEVRCLTRGRERTITAPWVLDATGRAGFSARRLGRRVDRTRRTLALVRTWTRAAGWPDIDPGHTLVESTPDGWTWSVPLSATRRQFTVMVDPALIRVMGAGDVAPLYRRELAAAPNLAALLSGCRPSGPAWARDASPYRAERSGEPGLLAIGDAGAFIDPLSSFGLKKAIASAWLGAVVVRTALEDPSLAGAALDLFLRREAAVAATLQARAAEFAAAAASAHPGEFWSRRRAEDDALLVGEPDPIALRNDPAVQAAMAELRRRPALAVALHPDVRRVALPTVREDRVVVLEHLVCPAFPGGVRWIRNVDLPLLASLAETLSQVPDVYQAYLRAAPPVPLPDFLGALAVLLGKGLLRFA